MNKGFERGQKHPQKIKRFPPPKKNKNNKNSYMKHMKLLLTWNE
jgi:hypothetical protein